MRNGSDIPLKHPSWFPCSDQLNQHHNLNSSIVSNPINHFAHAWKPDLIRSLYPYTISVEILKTPISKVSVGQDKLLWKHSKSGKYQVKKAYNLLLVDHNSLSLAHTNTLSIPTMDWMLIWKVKVPQKVCLFIWKLLQDCIPTFNTLRSRGIPTSCCCPFCDNDNESTSHLFLYCPFARAIWLASSLNIHTSILDNVIVQS